MLIIKNLRKEFKNVVAVDNLSFSIEKGKIFGLLGPNGAGKTTTIRVILNIIKPSSGEVTFNGEVIDKKYYDIIGYLPEERGLYRNQRVIDVILYFASLKNLSRHEALTKANYWLDRMGMQKYSSKRVRELSKGSQQKVQFITAVLHNPELLILDEPFTGFDPINQQLIKEVILSFAREGRIIILSTHQMETAEKLCSDILLINEGKGVCSGSLSSIKKRFAANNVKIEFEGDASFISSLPMIESIDFYNNCAEVQLAENYQPNLFLKSLIEKITIKHFSIIEPTLNKIFIDVIKENHTNK